MKLVLLIALLCTAVAAVAQRVETKEEQRLWRAIGTTPWVSIHAKFGKGTLSVISLPPMEVKAKAIHLVSYSSPTIDFADTPTKFNVRQGEYRAEGTFRRDGRLFYWHVTIKDEMSAHLLEQREGVVFPEKFSPPRLHLIVTQGKHVVHEVGNGRTFRMREAEPGQVGMMMPPPGLAPKPQAP